MYIPMNENLQCTWLEIMKQVYMVEYKGLHMYMYKTNDGSQIFMTRHIQMLILSNPFVMLFD